MSDVPGEDLRLGDVVVWRACVRAAVFMVFFGDGSVGEWMGGDGDVYIGMVPGCERQGRFGGRGCGMGSMGSVVPSSKVR